MENEASGKYHCDFGGTLESGLPDSGGASHNANALDGQHMLKICIVPECTTIVFGNGTCTDHDPQRSLREAKDTALSLESPL